jgi:ATP-binding cassette, subfamily B, bacterial
MSGVPAATTRLLWQSWRQDRLRLMAAVLLMAGQAVALPLAAATLAALTNAVLAREVVAATVAAIATAVLVIAALTLGHFAHIAYFELGELNMVAFDQELIDISNGSEGIGHHERPEYADKFHVLRQELQRLGWNSMQVLLPSMGLAVAIGLTAVLLGRLNPWLLLLPVTAVPPLLTGRLAERLLARARERAAPARRLAWHLFEVATEAGSAKEVRVCGLQQEVRRRHAELWAVVTRIRWRTELAAAAFRVAGQLAFAAGYVAGVLLIVYDAMAGRRSVGDVVLVISLAAQVNQQMSATVSVLQELQRIGQALATLRWARGLVASGPSPATAIVPRRLRRGIELRDVSFGYPGTGRTVLDRVSVFLPAGSTVALVGENGAGKSSLVKLLCRFYEPTGGVMEVDGVDVRRFPVPAWRERIAAGFQDFVRFEFLARQAVGVGDLPAADSDAAVVAALERAGATDLLDRLEHGLDTQLGKSYAAGTELSGGQWQRLALGRAMMRPAPLLLVLDEPTSGVDAEAEHRLFERYASNARRTSSHSGAVTILVSHRFSTVQTADLILVVADGRITEAGSHPELVAAGGRYAELYRRQAAGYR